MLDGDSERGKQRFVTNARQGWVVQNSHNDFLQQFRDPSCKRIRQTEMQMRASLTTRPATVFCLPVILLFVSLSLFGATPGKGDELFRECLIPELQIELSSQAFRALSRDERTYVQGTIREGTRIYTNVAIRLKGGPGSYRSLNDNPAFTVNFDKFAPGQTFHGLKKIHLNNSVQDRSFMHEKISRELFDAAGVPVPRAGNAWVRLNDRVLGLYVLVEGVNKQFLKRYFPDTGGNVYDGHSGNEVNQRMEVNSGDAPRDQTRLRALANAARETDLEKRRAALEETLDVDRFLSFMALELILQHWDGYTIGRNNFRIFHDRATDRLVFLAHGLDQVLGRRMGTYPSNPSGLVARSVLEVPEFRARYRERVAQLATNVFDADKLTHRIGEVAAKIQTMLARHDDKLVTAHQSRTTAFIRRIQKRSEEIQATPTSFDGLGVARLTNWVQKLDLGDASLEREDGPNGTPMLRISTKEGCTASWRSIVEIPPGQYRFQGRVKTRGVIFEPEDARRGAGLRISRHRDLHKNDGDTEWTPVSFDFDVPEDRRETVLVCELRARRGEVWFDLASLKLIRK
jgi:spore coat protein CotH